MAVGTLDSLSIRKYFLERTLHPDLVVEQSGLLLHAATVPVKCTTTVEQATFDSKSSFQWPDYCWDFSKLNNAFGLVFLKSALRTCAPAVEYVEK